MWYWSSCGLSDRLQHFNICPRMCCWPWPLTPRLKTFPMEMTKEQITTTKQASKSQDTAEICWQTSWNWFSCSQYKNSHLPNMKTNGKQKCQKRRSEQELHSESHRRIGADWIRCRSFNPKLLGFTRVTAMVHCHSRTRTGQVIWIERAVRTTARCVEKRRTFWRSSRVKRCQDAEDRNI